MKKILFFFALLASVTASATVTITPLSTNYSAVPPTVTFKVEWTGNAVNNRIWVWVDLCPVARITAGTFIQAVIGGATATAGSIDAATLNGRGFYVTTNPSTVTATLSNATGQFNWCAYGSDFPPNAYVSGGSYTLRGSPPFVVNGSTLTVGVTHYVGNITSLTDATGAPGILCMPAGQAPGKCGCCSGLSVNVSTGLCTAPTFCDPSSTVSLGVVSFTPGTEITITGSSYTQVWSRPVTATGCQKTTFNGGTAASVKSDCRTNPGYAGDYISWCAAVKYSDQLCPFPWHVPTAEDFCRLHQALTGAACVDTTNAAWTNIYVNQWDLEWNGYAIGDSYDHSQAFAAYICRSMTDYTYITANIYNPSGQWTVSAAGVYGAGRTLRCVRD